MHVVILSGGSGTRLWPASRADRPKQFLRLFGADSLLIETARRALAAQPAALWVLTNDRQLALAREEMSGADLDAAYLVEPEARNTGPAIVWAAARLARQGVPGAAAFLPADHHVADQAGFAGALRHAAQLAEEGEAIVVIGKPPTRPETGYGYIERAGPLGGGAYGVKRFVEKPDEAEAERLLLAGGYWWNTGIVVARPQTILDTAAAHAPDVAAPVIDALERPERYADAPKLSFDAAVLERSANLVMLEAPFDWSDVGTWSSWAEHAPSDAFGNAMRPGTRMIAVEARRNAVWGERKIVIQGVDDLIIVDTDDYLLITRRPYAQSVGALAKKLAA